MNLLQKCSDCCKVEVCAIKNDYQNDIKRIEEATISEATTINITCKWFEPRRGQQAGFDSYTLDGVHTRVILGQEDTP